MKELRMDVQDATNLVMPEGEVKAIHDSASRLLWGRVNYDTKYVGDTMQPGEPTPDSPQPVNVVTGVQNIVVHGKNLFGIPDVAEFTRNGVKISVKDGVLSLNGTATASTGVVIANLIDNLVFQEDRSYTFSKVVISGTASGSWAVQIRDSNSNTLLETLPNSYPKTYSGVSGVGVAVRLYYANGRSFNNYKIKIQAEERNVASVFEAYQSSNYTIDLGAIELCKIGASQDYIYKSVDDWYVHKETDKMIVDGVDTTWTVVTSSGSPDYYYAFTPYYDNVDNAASTIGLSNKFIRLNGISSSTVVNSDSYSFFEKSSSVSQHFRLMIKQSRLSSGNSAGLNSFLSDNPASIYYALATPTDTQIADAALISQLNTVHEWLTRYGYNATVSGNLPLIVDRTNL